MVIEAVDGDAGLGLGQHLDEQLERADAEIGTTL
jgi:hypothetical protein